jgi:hypothetical protein
VSGDPGDSISGSESSRDEHVAGSICFEQSKYKDYCHQECDAV